MQDIRIAPVTTAHLGPLADLLVATVASGGSVSFLHPLDHAKAKGFWTKALADMEAGGRIILGAFAGEDLAASVSLILDMPENQPHRAEIGKMMTAPPYRGRGIARALLQAAENLAIAHGKSLLVLDTAAEGGAAGLYEKAGYIRAGSIPDFALLPQGGLAATILFYKRIGAA